MGTIEVGVPTSDGGSSNSITLTLSYRSAGIGDEITNVNISWRDDTGNMLDSEVINASRLLDSNTNRYTIPGLTPSTNYVVTLIAINQCGSGTKNNINVATNSGTDTNNRFTTSSTTAIPSTTTILSATVLPSNPSMYVNALIHKMLSTCMAVTLDNNYICMVAIVYTYSEVSRLAQLIMYI